jgi:membrane protease YdiL (CAAX protease family)
MRSLLRRYPVVSYFTLAFGISWGGILVVIRGGAIPASPAEAHRLFGPVYLAMLAGPSLAGLVMTGVVGGRRGLRDYRARLLEWRVSPTWYGVAFLTAPFALLVTWTVLSQFSPDFAPAIFGSGAIDPAGPIQAESVRSLLPLAVAVGLGAGLFEELGWTGFAIPTLLSRLTALSTSLVVGVLWGAWHFVAVWWGSATAFASVPIPVFLLVALFSFLPPYRILMVRVYERTGSTLIAILMHASLTANMIILGPAVNGTKSVVYNLTFAASLWAIAAAVPASDRMRRLAHHPTGSHARAA